MKEYNLKHFAHMGDAVWEVFARKIAIDKANTQKALHIETTKLVRADFQADLFDKIEPYLKENEKELAKRGRNLPLTVKKKSNQNIHRKATAFEVLIGFFYLSDKKRLEEFFKIIKKEI